MCSPVACIKNGKSSCRMFLFLNPRAAYWSREALHNEAGGRGYGRVVCFSPSRWEGVLSHPLGDSKLDKGRLRHVHFGNEGPKQAMWLNKMHKHTWARVPTFRMDAQVQNVAGESQVPISVGDELEGFCEKGQLDLALDVLLRMDQECNIPSVNM